MCYDVSYLTRKAEKYAKYHGAEVDWADLLKRVLRAFPRKSSH